MTTSQFHHKPVVGVAVRRGEGADPTLLAQVHDQGFCILPALLTHDEVVVARAATVAASEQAAARGYPTVMEALDPGGRNVRSPDLLAYNPLFADLVMHPGAVPYVAALLTDDWVMSNFSGNNGATGQWVDERALRPIDDHARAMARADLPQRHLVP